jgi:hypothetical protein
VRPLFAFSNTELWADSRYPGSTHQTCVLRADRTIGPVLKFLVVPGERSLGFDATRLLKFPSPRQFLPAARTCGFPLSLSGTVIPPGRFSGVGALLRSGPELDE